MRGILLINTGTPASKEKADVKKFICEMLSDPLVMGRPEWQSKFLARNIIAPFSASRSTEKYKANLEEGRTGDIAIVVSHAQALRKARS